MLSLLSTFLYALLTDRVLLVRNTDDFTDLFCEPFPDTTWSLPPDFPVANMSQLGVQSDDSYGNLLRHGRISNHLDRAHFTPQHRVVDDRSAILPGPATARAWTLPGAARRGAS
jgi:xyloglucan fucosyltransferase